LLFLEKTRNFGERGAWKQGKELRKSRTKGRKKGSRIHKRKAQGVMNFCVGEGGS